SEPPTYDRRSARELPNPWQMVYHGFVMLQVGGVLAGITSLGGMTATLAAIALDLPALRLVSFGWPVVLLGPGVVGFVGHILACNTPARFGGEAARTGMRVFTLVFLCGAFTLPLVLLIYALMWRRFLSELGSRLQDRRLQTQAEHVWWLGALVCFLLL